MIMNTITQKSESMDNLIPLIKAPSRNFKKPDPEEFIQILKAYPEPEELQEFIGSSYKPIPLKIKDNKNLYRVNYNFPWPGVIILGWVLFCLIMFYSSKYDLRWMVYADSVFYMLFITWAIQQAVFRRINHEKTRFIYHKNRQILEIPFWQLEIPQKDLLEICVLTRRRRGFSLPGMSELSAVYRSGEEIRRVFLAPARKSEAKRIAGKLSEYTQTELRFLNV